MQHFVNARARRWPLTWRGRVNVVSRRSAKAKTWKLNVIIAALFLVAAATLFLMGNARTLLSLAACLGLVVGVSHLLHWWNPTAVDIPKLSVLAYMVFSVIGLAVVINNRMNYGIDFGPSLDDSWYFAKSLSVAHGMLPAGSGPYDLATGSFAWCLSFAIGEPQVIDLLPLNWAFGALCVGLSSQLAFLVTGRRCSTALLFAAVVGNSVFSDSVTHLYRDVFMLMFFLIAIVGAVRGKYITAILSAVACAMVRGGHGMLAFAGIVFVYLSKARIARASPILFWTGVMTVVAAGWLVAHRVGTARYLPDYVRAIRSEERLSIIERARAREDVMMGPEKRGVAGSLTSIAYQLGPVGYILRPIVAIFTPVTFHPVRQTVEVHTRGVRPYLADALRLTVLLHWITTLLWIVLGPPLVLGLVRAARGTTTQKAILVLFVVAVFAVSFVSFQPRHRCPFILLFPTFLALAAGRLSTEERLFLRIARTGFLGGILLINLVRYL